MKSSSLLLTYLLINEILMGVEQLPTSDTKKGYINASESFISKMMMNVPIIRSIYGGIRLLINIYKERDRSIRESPLKLEIKENYDAREAYPKCKTIGTITPMGYCNACWAVAVVTAFSDRICIHSGGKNNYHMSVEQMLACNRQNHGCEGGEIYTAWKFLEEFPLVTGGPIGSTEEEKGCQPYQIRIMKPRKLHCSRDYCEITHKAKDVIVLPNNEYEIQREIQYYGPVSAQMTLYTSLRSHKGGHVYQKKPNDTRENPHFVRIIGWGVTDEEPKQKYWIVAESISRGIGEGGFFKILRGTNECDIESRVVSGLPYFYTPSN